MLNAIKDYIKSGLNFLYKNRAYIILIVLAVLLVFVGYEYYHEYFDKLKDPRAVKKLILSYDKYSVFAFLTLQIIQVVAFFIPGEIIQIAGGYIFGTFLGGVISLIGITLGSIFVYSISNFYGKPFIKKIISKKHLNFFDKILKLGSINYIVFLLYLIPGIPKDVLAYVCGISDISFKNFVIYSTLGRIPGIFISTFFGSNINTGHRGMLIAIAVFMSVFFIIGVFKGERIIKALVKKEKG